MNANDFQKDFYRHSHLSYEKKSAFLTSFNEKTKGQKGITEKRERMINFLKNRQVSQDIDTVTKSERLKNWKEKQGLELSKKVDLYFDEHGRLNGDPTRTYVLDYISKYHGSMEAPFFDMGGEGLAVIKIIRTRYYAKSSKWRPSSDYTVYLVGKNEAGTYFAHPVSKGCYTVESAVNWIWSGNTIVKRQGDIALVKKEGKERGVKHLPSGHELYKKLNLIYHKTHPVLNMKKYPDCYIIVGRRAVAKIGSSTRD